MVNKSSLREDILTIENLHSYHLVNQFQQKINSPTLAKRVAFREWSAAHQRQLTWQEIGQKTKSISLALLELGVNVQENVAIFADNGMNWSLTDLAILQLRAVTVPLYSTSSVTQATYILNDANIRILFVGDQVQYDIAKSLFEFCPKLTDIIVFNEDIDISDCPKAYPLSALIAKSSTLFLAELKQRIAQHQLSDLFTLIYTSGTTGEPKGVMLDYANMAAQLYLHDKRLTLTESDISLCFLPLSHVFERAWSFYVMHIGAQNVI